MSFTPAIPSLSAPMGASPKPTLVLDLEGVAGQEVKLHEWLDASDGSYYDCVVDWGDGTVERVNEDNFTTISHTYASSSVKARVAGKFGRVTSRESVDTSKGLRSYLKHVEIENTCPLTNPYQAFRAYKLLDEIPARVLDNMSNVTLLNYFFNGCSGLSGEIPKGLFNNTPNVTSFTACFYGCSGLSGEIPKGLFDNTPNVTSFAFCFNNCSGLSGDIPTTLFDNNTNGKNFTHCFNGCNNTISAPLNLWRVTEYTNALPNSANLKTVHFVNLPDNDEVIDGCIDLLYDRSTLDEKGTLIIRKNITEARDSLTEEQEAALNARGWILGIETAA